MNNDTNTAPSQETSGLFGATGAPDAPQGDANKASETAQNEAEGEASTASMTEKQLLMGRARMMGIPFSNNISVEKLREKVNAKLDGLEIPKDDTDAELAPSSAPATPPAIQAQINALTGQPGVEVEEDLRTRLLREEMKLVRVRITNLDPKKKDLPGEIITVANEFIGTVRKYVPFGEVTENGYHIPMCIYRFLDERRFLNLRTRKNGPGNTPIIETGWAREFALEILPPLTQEELDRLATAQAAAGSIDTGLEG